MKSRQLIDLNKAQIRQSLEEHLRQLDSKLLIDPYLSDLKSQLLEVLVQTIGQSSIDDLVVTEVRESKDDVSLEFVSQGHSHTPRRLVATLRDPSHEEGEEENITEAEHAHAEEGEASDAHSGVRVQSTRGAEGQRRSRSCSEESVRPCASREEARSRRSRCTCSQWTRSCQTSCRSRGTRRGQETRGQKGRPLGYRPGLFFWYS